MSFAPPKKDIDYERVSCDDWIEGAIFEIQEDMAHKFTYKGQESTQPGVRFVFELKGYNFKHYSRWMKFNYGMKANLYLKYLMPLVDGAKPDMVFDIQDLKGLAVKTIWKEDVRGDQVYQSIETIRPLGKKLKPLTAPQAPDTEPVDQEDVTPDDVAETPEEEIPF